jgi:predicted ester cyclase
MTCKGILILVCSLVLIINSSVMGQEQADVLAVRAGFAQALDGHIQDEYMSFFAADAVWDWVSQPAPFVGHEQIAAMFDTHISASPDDWRTDQGRVMSVDNIVMVEHAALGTQTGPLPGGLPPSGNEWVYPHLDIYEIEGDKIKRLTTYGDAAGVYIQWGLMPVPEMPELAPSFTLPDPEPTGLSPMEANADQVNRWNSHDAALMAEIYHADAQIFAGPLGMVLDRVAMTAMNEMFFSAFPDVALEVVRAIDLGDGWVVTEFVSRSTHQGPFMGIPAAGYPTEIRGVWLTRYNAQGLVIEGAFYYDSLTLMNQLITAPWPLDGIWVSAIPTPLGNLILTTTYVAQDASKTRYSGSLEEINAMPLLAEIYPDADPTPKWAGGQAVMVGRNKYEVTFLGYRTKIVESDIGKTTEFVGLFTVKGYFELLGPDMLQGHGTGSYYLAVQDADRDGFPDEGQEPVACVPWTWTGKRLTAMPGCTPTPMP